MATSLAIGRQVPLEVIPRQWKVIETVASDSQLRSCCSAMNSHSMAS